MNVHLSRGRGDLNIEEWKWRNEARRKSEIVGRWCVVKLLVRFSSAASIVIGWAGTLSSKSAIKQSGGGILMTVD